MEHCARHGREECLQRLTQSSQCRTQIVNELASIARGLGFDYCSYVMQVPLPLTKPAVVWSSTYPALWLKHYFAHGYLTIDPLRSICPAIQYPWSGQPLRLRRNRPSGRKHARMGSATAGPSPRTAVPARWESSR